jgi:hypothetical protein
MTDSISTRASCRRHPDQVLGVDDQLRIRATLYDRSRPDAIQPSKYGIRSPIATRCALLRPASECLLMNVYSTRSTFRGRDDAAIIYRIVQREKHYAKTPRSDHDIAYQGRTLCLDLTIRNACICVACFRSLLLKRD